MVKIHGNWCGPDWTGGKKVSASKYRGSWNARALDSLDRACRAHDKACAENGCCRRDDDKLIRKASKISQNPMNLLFKPTYAIKAAAVATAMNIARITRRC